MDKPTWSSPRGFVDEVDNVAVAKHRVLAGPEDDVMSMLTVQAREQRHQSEGFPSEILGQSMAGIAQTDLSGRFIMVNQRYCEIVGRSAEELRELRMQDITHPDDLAGNLRQFSRLFEEEREFTVAKRYVRPDGSFTRVQNTVCLIKGDTGTPVSVIAFTVDLTDRYQVECDRLRLLDLQRAAHDELSDANHRKDDFLAMLGHELRNPLSDIVSAMQVLEQVSCCDSVTAEMHGIIQRQSRHMTKLIDDLLDVSRIACGKILLELGPCDLVAMVRDAVADHQQHFDANRLTLVLELPDAPICVLGDATRLSQVLTNLLHNATKFTDPGGTITVQIARSRTSVVLSVHDTGIGMEPSETAEMFELFRQGESRRVRCKGGLGLGLALSKRLIEKLGGAITAASEGVGRGSQFSIHLPLNDAMPSERAVAAVRPRAAIASHRILIVDDGRDTRLTMTTLLKRMGQQVESAECGAGALDAARRFCPEIVFCDIGLPDMDGYDVARALRTMLGGAKLIALTGYGQADDRERALKAGFDLHWTKPVSYDQLRDVLV